MTHLSIVTDRGDTNQKISRQLAQVFDVRPLPLDTLSQRTPGQFNLIDVDLANGDTISVLKHWLRRRPKGAQVILTVDESASQQALKAFSLGATDVVTRPVRADALLVKFFGELGSLRGDLSTFSGGIAAGVEALQCIFASASLGDPLDPQAIAAAGDAVVSQIEENGFDHWIASVRNHHSQTYQHCLIVTGIAVTFGRSLGFASADLKRLSSAGLLHDTGKARIPLTILEKPGPLDERELAVMRQHSQFGYDALKDMPDIAPDILDVVVHHHEYLDGSGYPHGLAGSEVSDLVRVMTIADVFGALIERRSYKAPMAGEQAYDILKQMGDRLDRDILRAFEPISKIRLSPEPA